MDQVIASGIDLPTRIHLERPAAGMPIRPREPFSGAGWALCGAPVTAVKVFLGPDLLCDAAIGLASPEVGRQLWFYPGADTAGFAFAAELPPELTAAHDMLRLVFHTPEGTHEHSLALAVAPPRPEPPPPTPAAQVAAFGFTAPAPPVLSPQASLPEAMLLRVEDARVNEHGVLRVRGWAVSFSPVEEVGISVGGRSLGPAQIGIARGDVGDALPDYPEAATAGFVFQQALDASVPEGELLVRAVAQGGIVREARLKLERPRAAEAPAIAASGEVHFHCDVAELSEDGILGLLGWAACGSGVRQIEVELDGEVVGSAELGGARPDVGNSFPLIPSARNAGFRLRAALGRACIGEHIVRLTIRGEAGEERRVTQAVRAQGLAGRVRQGREPTIRYHLETPSVAEGRAAEKVRGFMSVAGWAFARAGIAAIELFVDGASQGHAHYGIRREDLQAAFPAENALLSGFAMLVPPQVMKPGSHEVRLVVHDRAGGSEEQSFTVEAEAAAEGPGPWQLRRKLRDAEIDLKLRTIEAAGPRPQFAVTLVGGGGAQDMAGTLATCASLRDQAYPDWRLRVVMPDTAQAAACARALEALPGLSPGRIEVVTPTAGLRADGLACLLRPGDVLGEDALLELAMARAIQPDADFLYSDERRVDPSDRQVRAFFKPDWSPELLLSTNYVGRLWAATPVLLQAAGVDLPGLLERGEYDAVLRATEHASCIVHVPKVLCARGRAGIDPPAQERRALAAALKRRGTPGEVSAGCIPGTYRIRRRQQTSGPDGAGLVSIVIPTIATRGMIQVTIDSLRAKTAYRRFEVICLDNIVPGDDPEKLHWKRWIADNSERVVELHETFNWARFNNVAARHARGEFLLFLNDDMEVLEPEWLDVMLEQVRRPEIGVVGPQLLYADGRVQHAGMFLGRSVGRHAFRFYPRDAPGPFGLARTQRNVIGVTGACMLMRRELFERLGGFDEAHAVVNNDLDFCLRVNRAGLGIVYTPHATLIHHEMVSRSKLSDVYDSAVFDAAWKNFFLRGDPFFNPNLTYEFDDYLPEAEPMQTLDVGHPIVRRERVKRILAVKVDHIGDFITAFPAFRRIKRHFPDAELVVLAARASLSVAPLEPAIDRVIEFNFFHAKSERGQRRSAAKELRELEALLAPERFDIALDLRRQWDTRHLLRHTGARWLAGFDLDDRDAWLDIAVAWEGDLARHNKRAHVVDALVQLVDAVSEACEPDRDVVRDAPGKAASRAAVAALPAVLALGEDLFTRRLACVHTGAGAENKQWPAKSFAELIDLLVAEEDMNVMLVGGPDEAAIAGETLGHVRHPARVFSLVGKTGLRDLPRVLTSCDLYVGNDSGPKHMAASLGVPTIGIHAGSVDTREWGPLGPLAFAIRRDVTCSPCYLAFASDCHRGLACLHGIRVGDVYRGCQRMLALTRPTPPH